VAPSARQCGTSPFPFPTPTGPTFGLLIARTKHLFYIPLHDQLHQLETGLPDQRAHSLLHGQRDLHRRQQQLNWFLVLAERCFETLHRATVLNLIWFAQGDSLLFFCRRIFQKAITPSG
jgi:hypothetical protein